MLVREGTTAEPSIDEVGWPARLKLISVFSRLILQLGGP